MNVSETVKRITELQLCGSDSRAQSYNEGLKAAIHILESCEQPHLNEDQQIVLDLLKIWQEKWPSWSVSTVIEYLLEQQNEYHQMLSKQEEAQVLQVFSQLVLEQEEK